MHLGSVALSLCHLRSPALQVLAEDEAPGSSGGCLSLISYLLSLPGAVVWHQALPSRAVSPIPCLALGVVGVQWWDTPRAGAVSRGAEAAPTEGLTPPLPGLHSCVNGKCDPKAPAPLCPQESRC